MVLAMDGREGVREDGTAPPGGSVDEGGSRSRRGSILRPPILTDLGAAISTADMDVAGSVLGKARKGGAPDPLAVLELLGMTSLPWQVGRKPPVAGTGRFHVPVAGFGVPGHCGCRPLPCAEAPDPPAGGHGGKKPRGPRCLRFNGIGPGVYGQHHLRGSEVGELEWSLRQEAEYGCFLPRRNL